MRVEWAILSGLAGFWCLHESLTNALACTHVNPHLNTYFHLKHWMRLGKPTGPRFMGHPYG